jgi:hypothetical protein
MLASCQALRLSSNLSCCVAPGGTAARKTLAECSGALENRKNLTHRAQQAADRGRHREQPGVLTDKTRDLQAQRQAVDQE